MFRILTLAAAGLLLAACAEPLESGMVVEKQHEEAHEFVVPIYVKVGQVLVPIMTHHYDDEDFVLIVQSDLNGKRVRQRLYVTRSMWERLDVGEMYYKNDNEPVALTDPMKKTKAG